MGMMKSALTGGFKKNASRTVAPEVGVGKGVITPDQATIDRFKPKGLAKVPTNRSKEEQAQIEANARLTTSYRGSAQPMVAAAAKPAVGAPLQKKSIGKVLRRGLIGRR